MMPICLWLTQGWLISLRPRSRHILEAKKIANWMAGPVLIELNERHVSIDELKLTPKDLVVLIAKVEEGVVSNLAGKDVLTAMLDGGRGADEIIKEKGLAQVSDDSALLGDYR